MDLENDSARKMSQSLQLIVLTVSGPLKTHMTSYYQKCAPVLAPVVEEAKHFFLESPSSCSLL